MREKYQAQKKISGGKITFLDEIKYILLCLQETLKILIYKGSYEPKK